MRSSQRSFLFGFYILVAACLVSHPSQAVEATSEKELQSAIPAKALLVVQFDHLQDALLQLKSTALFHQFSESSWKPLIDSQDRSQSGSWLSPKPWLGLDWEDLTQIEGPGILALVPSDKEELEFLFLTKLGNQGIDHAIVRRWMDHCGGSQGVDQSKVNSWTLLTSKSASKTGKKPTLAVGQNWSCLSESLTLVERWMQTQQSEPVTSFEFGTFKSESKQNLVGRFWCSPWTLFHTYTKQNDPKLAKRGERFGLESVGFVHGQIYSPKKPDTDWQIQYALALPKQPQRGLALLSYSTGPAQEFPKVFSANMDQIAQSYVDIRPWFQGVSHAVDMLIDEETTGNFADLLDSILTDPEGPKVDMRKELIYRMGPLMMFGSESEVDEKAHGGLHRNQLWCCSLQDAKQAASVMEKLFHGDDEVRSSHIGTVTFWRTINQQSLLIATTNEGRNGVTAAAIDDTFLYLSNSADWLEQRLLASQNATLPSDEQSSIFRDFARINVGPISTSQVIRVGPWLKSSWQRVPETNSPKERSVDWVAWLLTKSLIGSSVAISLPSFEKVEKNFGTLMHHCLRTADGIEGNLVYVDAKID